MEPMLTFRPSDAPTSREALLSKLQEQPAAAEPQEHGEFERYMCELRAQQAHYRLGVAEAGRPLSGSVAEIAAVHARLAQQFLDAQRGLIVCAVEAVGRLATIGSDANMDSTSIDDVATSGIDLAGLEARMRSRLDRWWTEEATAVQSAVDAALARDQLRRHLERIDFAHSARAAGHEATTDAIVEDAVDALPERVLDLIEAAELDDLDRLFRALLDVLDDPAPSRTAPAETVATQAELTGEPAVAPASPTTVAPLPPVSAGGSDEQFAGFWGSGPGPVGHVTRPWRFVQMLLPTSVVVAGIALVLAWVG